MDAEQRYSLIEIEKKLKANDLPLSGVTALGSSKFHIAQPAFYAGIAMHAGDRLRPDIQDALAVSPQDKYREEDPFTDLFIRDFPIQIICRDSRFEYDVNREYQRGIYDEHKKTWGLKVWKHDLTAEQRAQSLAKHQEFHDLLDIITSFMLQHNQRAVLFDMHSYCYQRETRQAWYEDDKPEVNVGTKAVNRELFGEMIHNFMQDLATIRVDSKPVRVLENDIFFGGHLSRRLSAKHYERVLVLALEFKKTFMDEWSGQVYPEILETLITGFQSATRKLVSHDFFTA